MKFNSRSNAIKAKFLLIRIPLILALTVLVLQLFEVIDKPQILIGFAVVFALTLATTLIFRLHYVEGEISKKSLSIKFYHIFPLIREYREIEINIESLTSAMLEKRVGGLVKVLVLTVKTEDGIANYPEIPIGLLSKNDQEKLITALNNLI